MARPDACSTNTTAERVERVYRVIERVQTAHGSSAWFYRHLSEYGMDVTRQAVTRWIRTGEVPAGRQTAFERVLRRLERQAIRQLQSIIMDLEHK